MTKVYAVCGWTLGLLLVLPRVGLAGEALLADAAERQDKAAIRALLKRQVDVKAPQPDGATALHWAAHWNDLETVDLLLKAHADVNAKNDYAATPLWLAVENGGEDVVQRLVKAGANPNAATESGETPLMTAIRVGGLNVVRTLIAAGADVNAKGSRDQTPLMWAVGGSPDLVRVLLESGADVSARSSIRPEYVSFGRGDPQGGRLNGLADGTLTSDGSRPGLGWVQKGGFTPLLFAAQQGDLASAKLLLAAGADIHDQTAIGDTALMLAAHNDHGEFGAFLLDQGVDPNATGTGYTALHLAVARRNPELVKAMLAHGAKVNVQMTKGEPFTEGAANLVQLPDYLVGATPLLLAAALQQVDTIQMLAAAGADAKLSMKDGTTPLMAAMGINPGVRGFAPFRVVAGGGDTRILAGGGAPRAATPITESAVLETVKVLIDLGVDVNATRVGGVIYHAANARTRIGRGDRDTALHTATADKLPRVVEYLVSKGARLDVKDQWGMTPLDIATSKRGAIASGADDGGPVLGDARMAALLQKLTVN